MQIPPMRMKLKMTEIMVTWRKTGRIYLEYNEGSGNCTKKKTV